MHVGLLLRFTPVGAECLLCWSTCTGTQGSLAPKRIASGSVFPPEDPLRLLDMQDLRLLEASVTSCHSTWTTYSRGSAVAKGPLIAVYPVRGAREGRLRLRLRSAVCVRGYGVL